MRLLTYTIPIGAAATTIQTVEITDIVGRIIAKEVVIVIPNYTNVETMTFSIIDADGVTHYSEAALAKNTTHVKFPDRYIRPGYSLGMLMTGATGDAITITIKIEAEKGTMG